MLYAAFVSLAVYVAAPTALRNLTSMNAAVVVLTQIVAIFVAPVAEELFFRGGLWSRLRLHWSPLTTGVVTSVLFVALHVPEGLGRATLIIPAAIACALARHWGGSVRASIIVHMANNAAAGLITWIALWLGWIAWPG